MKNKEFKALKSFLAAQAVAAQEAEVARVAMAARQAVAEEARFQVVQARINSPSHLAWVAEMRSMNAWKSWS